MSGPHPRLSYVTHVYFDQEDTGSLDRLLEVYSSYSSDLLDQVEFIIVDDGSPLRWEPPEDLDLNLSLFRIEEDIPWNQAGARNLGVLQARADNVIVTDLDHRFPEETLRYCIKRGSPGKRMVRFYRRMSNGTPQQRPHGNTFNCSRSRFLRFFGYDEDFTGHYGAEDEMFWRWQRYHGTRFTRAPKRYYAQQVRVDREKSYHSLARDRTRNNALAERKKELWKCFGSSVGHGRRPLRFPWSLVAERNRAPSPPKANPYWSRSWLIRSLLSR